MHTDTGLCPPALGSEGLILNKWDWLKLQLRKLLNCNFKTPSVSYVLDVYSLVQLKPSPVNPGLQLHS